ncbi:MAG: hypothetical protein JRI23_33385 [Deltaproteobacteria bacterium]|nr:hypothetical protein [Deltaproteobacteria bacterium]MBW2537173.1 hypothetical protein [Deltaproteobacteria bacterium]
MAAGGGAAGGGTATAGSAGAGGNHVGGSVATGGEHSTGGGGAAGGAPATTEVFDPLTDAALRAGEVDKQVQGGSFTSDGWQATDGSSQLVIRLAQPRGNPGRLEIDVRNFDPKAQSTGVKHEIINLYSQANGSKEIFETLGSWWNVRSGTNYLADPMGIKFLSAVQGVATRLETRLQTAVAWDLTQTYRFAVDWTDTEITISLDGSPVQSHSWGAMAEPFEYVFIGTNNVYSAQVGPVYSNLRIRP